MVDSGERQDMNFFNSEPKFDLFKSNNYANAFSDILNDFNIKCSYFTEDNFCKTFNHSKDILGLSINIQSLHAKFSSLCELITIMCNNGITIGYIALQETWCSNLDHFSIPGFTLLGKGRNSNKGGGVAVYINSTYDFEILKLDDFFHENLFESMSIKIVISSNLKVILTNTYRPPSQNTDTFFNLLSEQLESLSGLGIPLIFTGDFNLNLLKCDHNTSQFLDLLSFYGMILLSSKASRIADRSSTLIDYHFTDNLNLISNTGLIIESPADHFINFIFLKSSKHSSKITHTLKRKFSNDNLTLFKDKIMNMSWDSVLQNLETNSASNDFLDKFNSTFEKCFPLTLSRENILKMPSFLSKDLRKLRQTCHRLLRKNKMHPTPENRANYVISRNRYNSLVRKHKKAYYNKKCADAGNDSKKLWNLIKEASNLTSNTNNISSLIVNDNKITSNEQMANHFNNHFTSLANTAKSYIPTCSSSFRDYLPNPTKRSFFMAPITNEYMLKYILSISPKTSRDINDISMKILHLVANSICVPLAHIFNLSSLQGIFPDNFKISKTLPIFKSGNKHDMGNYRGISLINSFSKIFEKIVSTRLTIFLEENNFFYPDQFGFRPNHSTQHVVMKIVNFITNSINDGKFALLLSFDILKCFDTVPHDILFSKLEHYGVRGLSLKWFKSYFQNRYQKVTVNGINSQNTCLIKDGILQGSTLGVLFFLLFINDLPNCSDILKTFLFADDNNSLIDSLDLTTLITMANNEIEKLKNWYSCNKLAINPTKSKFILFHPTWVKPNLPVHNGYPYLPLYINLNNDNESNIENIYLLKGVPNPTESSLKILGVLIDKNLSMKNHIECLQGKISRAVYSLRIMKNLLDKKHLKLLYDSYIHSHILYISLFLSLCSESTLKPLIKLQKKAIRIICNSGYRDHTAPLFLAEQILPVNLESKLQCLKLMHSYKYNKLPESFNNIWIENEIINPYLLRNAHDFNIPHTRYLFLFKHPLYFLPRLWNELDRDIREIQEKPLFINALKEFLFNQIQT